MVQTEIFFGKNRDSMHITYNDECCLWVQVKAGHLGKAGKVDEKGDFLCT